MAEEAILRLEGLSRADMLELSEYLPDADVHYEEQGIPEGSLGALPLVAAVVVVSVVALKGLVTFLAYRYGGTTEEREIEVRRPDGTRVRATVRFRQVGTHQQEAELARTLSDLTGLDPATILPAAGSQ